MVKVQDGDTITILTKDYEQIKIRLDGIDAAENGQDFSNVSKKYLSDLVAGKTVKVKSKGTDVYKRVLGIVYIGNTNVNEENGQIGSCMTI